jgi:uncharacterized delta-60 repeat protein
MRLPGVERLENRVLFASGDLDSLFAGGKVVKDLLGNDDYGFAVAVQADGKVLVGGRAGAAVGGDFGLIRLNADGTPDSTLGNAGVVTLDMGSSFDSAYAILVQSDGKIILGGETSRSGTSSDFALARFNANGTLDTTFGTSGKVVTDFATKNDQLAALALTSDGHIVAAGWATVSGLPQIAVAEYNASGQLESAFGTGGKTYAALPNGYSRGQAVAILGDGSVVVAGGASSFTTGETHFAAVKFSATGALDSTFGASGFAVASVGGDDETAHAVLVQTDGKLVLAGESYDSNTGGADFAVTRLSAVGAVDSSFGSSGVVRTDFAGDFDQATSAVLQSNGHIVVAGLVTVNGDMHFGVECLNTDGTLDTSFGGTGMVTIAFRCSDAGNAIALDAQGRIVVAGYSMDNAGAYDFAVARLIGRVNVAPTANAGGAYTVDANGSVQLNGAGSFDSDGSIVSYEWDFNYDGQTFDADATSATPTFSASGLSGVTRTIALRVTDNDGATSLVTTTLTVNVLPPPPPPVVDPPPSDPPPVVDPPPIVPAVVGAAVTNDPDQIGKQILIVHGTAKCDNIHFKMNRSGFIEVRMNGKCLGKFANVSKIMAYGEDGSDLIDARLANVPVNLFGGKGNDVLIGSRMIGDTLDGGDGHNVLIDRIPKPPKLPPIRKCVLGHQEQRKK